MNAFLMAGANSVLTKPVNIKALQAALAKFCPPLATPTAAAAAAAAAATAGGSG